MEFTVSDIIGASAEALYNGFLDGNVHSAMTGSPAVGSSEINGSFTAWGGYISGKNIELKPHTYIKQSWRTAQFQEGQDDSIVEISFEVLDSYRTKITLRHSNLTDNDGHYEPGWVEHYFVPMKKYFEK